VHGTAFVFDVYVFALLVQTVNAAHFRVFPADRNVETFVAELNLFYSCLSASNVASWSSELDSSLLSSNVVYIDYPTCKTDGKYKSIRMEFSHLYRAVLLNFH